MQGVLNQPVISGSTMLHEQQALPKVLEQYFREDR